MKRSLLVIAIFLVIIGIVVGIMLSNKAAPQPIIQTGPSPTPYLENGFRGINLNVATEGGVLSVMGTPVRIDQGKNQKTFIYASGVDNQPINVNVDTNNDAVSIIEPSRPGITLTSLQAALGKEDVVLYGNYYYSGYYLYTYLEQGTAVLANPKTDAVKQRWYFSPTNLDSFLQSVGVGFQTSPLPSGQE